MPKKISTFQKKKWIFGHFCDFAKITKMAKNPFFLLRSGNFFRHTLIIWGDNFFVFSILFDLIKKMGKIEKNPLSRMAHFFSFWPKNAKNINFHEKNLFLGIFLRVISVTKGFLYLWQTTIFEPARAILLRRVRYQALRMRVFGQKCQKLIFMKEIFSMIFSMINFYIFILCWSKVKYIYGRFHYVLMLGMVSLYSADFSVITRLVLVY